LCRCNLCSAVLAGAVNGGLALLKHARGLSDDAPSSLSRWRACVDEAGTELFLQATVEAARRLKLVKPSNFLGPRQVGRYAHAKQSRQDRA
jgi:hypothetical protein